MVKDVVLDLLYPRRCVCCDEALAFGKKELCPDCRDRIVYIEDPFCMKCGKQLADEREYCDDCRKREHAFIQGSAVFDYGSVADAMYRFKNQGRREYAEFFGKELYRTKKEWLRMLRPDGLVPVPIHKSRMRKRGYNQAGELAKQLSRYTGVPVYDRWIERVSDTKPLKELNAQERQNNLKRAFKMVQNDVKLNTIVIIDDIYTTGSTIDAMAQTIRESMDCRVYYLAVAIGRGN